MTPKDTIRDTVRAGYAARARAMTGSGDFIALEAIAPAGSPRPAAAKTECCAPPAKVATDLGYTPEDLAALPGDVGEMTLGCGDPVTLAGLQPGQVVVDLGSGAGMDCLLAAARVGESGRVIGVDMTPEMLSLAWKNVAQAGVHNVEFRYGHIEHLPIESASVDVVISNCVINLSPDKPAVFREALRVLKPGGLFAVSDIVADRDIDPVAAANMTSYCACVAGASAESRYRDELRAAGFAEVRITRRAEYERVPGTDIQTWSVKVEARRPQA
ncbi:MAG: arsenite methyltransferase [Thermoflexales bacterium]|nr:arsenite methyltransferase [Thermoflexales bacterium]